MHYKLDEYLELPRTQGIVRIFMGDRNYIIGCTTSISSMVRKKRRRLNENTYTNRYMQFDFNTYGEDAFQVEVLEVFEGYTKEQMVERKQYHMSNYKNLYNIATDGISRKGVRNTKEMNAAILQSAIGRPVSTETREKIAKAHRGENNISAKLKEYDIPYIRKMVNKGIDRDTIAEVYEVSKSTIARIAVNKGWSHV